MKQKLIILSTILLTALSCKVNEKPVFVKVENIEVMETTSKFINFTADAIFLNPNDVGGNLKANNIKVYVNDIEMTTISSESFDVPAKNEFSIPLRANLPIDSIVSDKSLSGLLGSLLTKKIKVQYKGEITYKALGFSYTYEIDKTDNVKLKF